MPRLLPSLALGVLLAVTVKVAAFDPPASAVASERHLSVRDSGALGDGASLDTAAIQTAIDRLAAAGGGTVLVPAGVFVSGALFLKPGVHLRLEKDAVLRASTEVSANFPPRRTRIEGHFEESFTPALINAERCDGFRLTGEGTLDGDGRKIWNDFWRLRKAAPDPQNFPNLSLPRARLVHISDSRDVLIDGVTFKDSQFWNLHLYKCREVLVCNASFRVPDDYRQAPSTDGIDVDSCQDVEIRGCHFSITDDCIAMKGSKGPDALADLDSPPVERVRVSDCVFKRGHAAVTLGSEATIVRDVTVENCRVLGAMTVANFKLRADTPQTYENITYRDIVLENSGGTLLSMQPWAQYSRLGDAPPPRSIVRNVTLTGITGRYGSFGAISANPGQTDFGEITLRDIDLRLKNAKLQNSAAKSMRLENVRINDAPATPSP